MTAAPDTKAAGVCAVTAADNRWLRCNIKAISLLANILLRQLAVDVDCAETVMLRDGFLTEGAASNIFVVKGGVLLAPPPSSLILTGITYDVVLELAAAHGIPLAVRPISEAEVRAADELWMTSSTKEIMAIVPSARARAKVNSTTRAEAMASEMPRARGSDFIQSPFQC